MLKVKRNVLSVALASAILASAGSAYAQQAEPVANQKDVDDKDKAKDEKSADGVKKLDAVVVTGIRAGIENAIEAKQSATSIVEAVSAEDIGKLPDQSIADSIARLPGLTAQRERGRATQINIRGFAGDFAATTLNGREQASTGDNRGVEFDQYPSELLAGVVVYKTPDASLVGQGLSGTVDLKTVRPLSFSERVLAVNFREDQNKVNSQKEYGNRYSFTYIDQFMDNTVGLSVGYAHLDSPAPGFQNEAWGYADGPGGTKVFGGGKLYNFDNNNKRDGVAATLQYKPGEFFESTLDVFYSKFKKTEDKAGVEFGTAWGQGVLQPGFVTNANGTITDSTWTNVKPVIRMDSNPIDDELVSVGWNNKFKINDNWSIDTDLSLSDITRDFRVLETYGGLAGDGTTTLRVRLDPDKGFNELTFGDSFNDPNNLRLIDAGNWGQDGFLKDFQINDTIHAARIDVARSFESGAFTSLEFGFNVTDREKDKSSDEAKLCITDCSGGQSLAYPGSASGFNFSGLDGLARFNANDLLKSGIYNIQPKFHPDIANKNWSVDETVYTAFTQINLDTDIGSMPLRGNAGVQYVSVDQSSVGFSTFSGNAEGTAFKSGAKYSNWLPSLNLSLGIFDETSLRVAAARQMARPRMDDLRASFDVSSSLSGCAGQPGPLWCGSGGNPELKPWLANAYDVSLEKYFSTEAGRKGYVSAAYFYKDLKTYIFKQDVPFDFAGKPLPEPTAGQVPGVDYPDSTVGVINQAFNGEGGSIKGIELTVSVPLDLAWRALEGFGLQGSYSDTKSKISPNGPGTSEPLPGLSKYVSNITAYYERGGFSARFSQRRRSAFRGETRGFGADLTFININAEKVQDAQVNYTFGKGALEGLSLYLQVSNIGDEPFTTSDAGDPSARPIQYFEFGRTTLLGFGYKF